MKKKVLFYCQSLWGVGHLVRSLYLIESLLEDFEVVLLDGGTDWGRTISRPGFTHVRLPPFVSSPNSENVTSPFGEQIDTVWAKRRNLIHATCGQSFDVLITEYFPFARMKFHKEVEGMLECLRSINPSVKVFSSIRDILNENLMEESEEKNQILRKYYHGVFVHGEKELSILPVISKNIPIYFTGSVSSSKSYTVTDPSRICISCGGGRYMSEFFERFKDVLHYLQNHKSEKLLLLPGPWSELKGESTLEFEVLPSNYDLEEVLAVSKLYIGTFGYNTAMAIRKFSMPSLIFPFPDFHEQEVRFRLYQNVLPIERLDKSWHQKIQSLEKLKPHPRTIKGTEINFNKLILSLLN